MLPIRCDVNSAISLDAYRIGTHSQPMKLITWRKSRKLSQAALAAKLGVRAATVTRYELGVRMPKPDVMARIYIVTGGKVRPTDFYDLGRETAA